MDSLPTHWRVNSEIMVCTTVITIPNINPVFKNANGKDKTPAICKKKKIK